jgi:CRP-like cAMP-binding protein
MRSCPYPVRAMPTDLSPATSNRLLSRLSESDFARPSPHLKRIDLPVRKKLEVRDQPIDNVYFPESGFASVVANGSGQRGIEVGLIGREGMTGLPIVMGTDRSTNETFIQSAGAGLFISAANLRKTIEPGGSIHRCFCCTPTRFQSRQRTRPSQMAEARSRSDWRAGS